MLLYWPSIIVGLASAVGCACLVFAMFLASRFPRRALPAPGASMPRVTILKPLHGAEPGLFENLASFCTQNYPGAVQIILGLQDPGDDAIAVVEQLRAKYKDCHLDLVVDATMHGLNRKVSNLVNMWRHVEHDVIVVADSDMRVDPDYLSRIVPALEQRGVGAVTCLYHGIPATGFWAQLAALGINAHFLPNVIMGLGLKLAQLASARRLRSSAKPWSRSVDSSVSPIAWQTIMRSERRCAPGVMESPFPPSQSATCAGRGRRLNCGTTR